MADYCSTDTPRAGIRELHLLAEADAASLASVAQTLADPLRVQMLHLLEQRPNLCTCEFAELLGLGQSRVSYHLKILLEAGIVAREIHGTWSHYSLRKRGVLEQVRGIMTEEALAR